MIEVRRKLMIEVRYSIRCAESRRWIRLVQPTKLRGACAGYLQWLQSYVRTTLPAFSQSFLPAIPLMCKLVVHAATIELAGVMVRTSVGHNCACGLRKLREPRYHVATELHLNGHSTSKAQARPCSTYSSLRGEKTWQHQQAGFESRLFKPRTACSS